MDDLIMFRNGGNSATKASINRLLDVEKEEPTLRNPRPNDDLLPRSRLTLLHLIRNGGGSPDESEDDPARKRWTTTTKGL
jgi:hypothetical protein